MALKTQKGLQIPEGAVLLSSKEALKFQWNFIKNWPSEVEVFSIKFGKHISAASTAFSSFYIINFFKKALNVNGTRFVLTLTPGVIFPATFTYFITDSIITDNALIMKMSCPICDQLKFAGCQLYLSLIFPTFYGQFSLSNFALISQSYPVPNFRTHGREFWKFSYNLLKQGTPHFQVVGLLQTVLILFLPYMQSKQLSNVMIKSERLHAEAVNTELQSGF